ncbi:type II toxin-antitoxin system RelE/ParE family toxin [Streptomyces albus]|uniref:type II toxin-antitoxin system RelE family toxin n=1 Tax=Streptomyces albus TaxID=1888 RepID=UPI0004C5C4D7|nr:type II toxin-antitoxin system RelE/ParE family toxin [Streptomyces albus]
MSEYRTVFRPEAQAELRKVPRDMALRILAKLTELESDPLGFSTTALVSQPDRRRLRVGDYRIIYTIDNGELVAWVIQVGHRSTVHESRS